MRHLLVLFALGLTSLVRAHEFYFAFAEMEFNEMESRFELTITATTHDVERSLTEKGLLVAGGKWNNQDTVLLQVLEKDINRHFELTLQGAEEKLHFTLEGFETELTGITRFYLSSPSPVASLFSMHIFFDFLMDTFPDQQNKLTFIYRGHKQTVAFLPSKKTQTITFE